MFLLLMIGSLLCIAYYVILVFYAGFHLSFSAFWLIAGIMGVAFCGLRLLLKRWGKWSVPLWLRVAGITAASAFAFIFIIVLLLVSSNMLSDEEEDLQYIIVLGAGTNGGAVGGALEQRLDRAVRYLLEHEETIVIVSGGLTGGDAISEAELMRLYLMEQGIPRVRIRQEVRSRNTAENLAFSKYYTKGSSSIGIITNDFHIFRVRTIARKQGYDSPSGILAGSDPVLRVHFVIRECFAVLKDKFMGNL